jgi:glycosyltransferase involved in cell wall biosynthesis
VLLQYLIQKINGHPAREKFYFLLDPRFERPEGMGENFEVIPNKQTERYKFYKRRKTEIECAFCFANTPPPIRLKAPVYTYFHNQKLLEAPGKRTETSSFKIYLKYLVVKLFRRNTDYFIVQTRHMVQEMLAVGLTDAAHCLSFPFYDDSKYRGGGKAFAGRTPEFVFISNPSPQKNYPLLLDAWEELLRRGLKPVLHVTVDNTAPAVSARMQELIAMGADIRNHVYIDPRELYFNCKFLIFPSVVESFGLPLIEAADSGMKIIASDLPYVHDVVKPSLVFDPRDKNSIANAVCRALETELPFPQVVTHNQVDALILLLADAK